MDFKNFSLIELSDLISTGKATREDIYAYYLDRTKQYNDVLNAFNTLPEPSLPPTFGHHSQ
jgi:Asp-tRNA(Asn)/Glu-tRNA(Gln) amidotransferase A subunit family amidase